jgi:hypothetical protein
MTRTCARCRRSIDCATPACGAKPTRPGRLEDRPKRLKARVLPFDDVDMNAILTDLVQAGFILRYVVDGRQYLGIKPSSWAKHQRPRNDEPESVLPSVDTATVFVASLCSDELVTVESLGREGKGKELEGKGEPADAVDAPDTCADFSNAWNADTSAPVAACQQLTAKRRKHIGARLAERPLTEWREVFRRINSSSFCRGANDRGWVASFDWVVGSADVAVKVLEGKYDNRGKAVRRAESEYSHWSDECAAIHGGACAKQWDHGIRMKNEKAS